MYQISEVSECTKYCRCLNVPNIEGVWMRCLNVNRCLNVPNIECVWMSKYWRWINGPNVWMYQISEVSECIKYWMVSECNKYWMCLYQILKVSECTKYWMMSKYWMCLMYQILKVSECAKYWRCLNVPNNGCD